MTTTTVTWKTQENVSGGSTTPSTSGVYGLRGNFEGGNDWSTTVLLTEVSTGVFEGTVITTGAAEFKVVEVKEDDPDYILKWIGNGEANVKLSKGTYKITYTVSTNKITVTAA